MSAASKIPEFVIIGQVIKPHGVRGAVKVQPITDDPQRYASLERVFLGAEDHPSRAFTIKRVQFQNNFIILTLDGIKTRNDAETWRRRYIQIPREETAPLPEGAQYFFQLIGLRVVTNKGDFLGTVEDVVAYPANNVFVVAGEDREILIPDIPDVIEKVDLDEEEIVINPLQGLLD